MKTGRIFSFSLLLSALALGFGGLPVCAASITVNTTNDSGSGSLRQAIAGAGPGDTITFDLVYPATITLTSGQLEIGKDLSINGPGASNLIISGNNISRLFAINSGATVTISGVTIANGNTGSAGYDGGGGILNMGTLTVTDSLFLGNSDTQAGGYGGGAITNLGALSVTGSTFQSNNASQSGGGAIASGGTMEVTNCMFSSNTASQGGAIVGGGTMNVTNSTFSANIATASGGGGSGGAINAGWATLSVLNSTFSGNKSIGAGGQGGGGGIRIIAGSTIVSNSTFINNTTNNVGGGIEIYEGSLEVHNSTFSANSAGNGGGGVNNFYDPGYTASVYVVNTVIANSSQGNNCGDAMGSSNTNNFSTDDSCYAGFTQVTPAQLALGSLTGDPGYLPLKFGSVAIDSGTDTDCPATDQRGVSRPQDGNGDGIAICDVGSYEAVFVLQTNKLFLPLALR